MIILNNIYTVLKQGLNTVPGIKKIDWYNEQYRNTEDEKATRYPAVYIEFSDGINWMQSGDKWQHGILSVSLHCVLFDILDSPVRTLQFAQDVFTCINSKGLYDADGNQLSTELVRIRSSFPKRYNQLKVAVLEFECEIFDTTDRPIVVGSNPDFIINS